MRAIVAIATLLAVQGCGALFPPGELPAVPYHQLPNDRQELHRIADKVYRSTREVDALVRARTALKKAGELGKPTFGTSWRLARIGALLARWDEDHAKQWADECKEAAERAREANAERVEGHLYVAICNGLVAQHRPSQADDLIKELIVAAERANEIAPHYQRGEARRLLGAIYMYAPPWPSGVGDLDEAIEVLESVYKEFPKEPLNIFYLAEAYRRAERRTDAIRGYKLVLRFPPKGLWALEGPPYREQARQALREMLRP